MIITIAYTQFGFVIHGQDCVLVCGFVQPLVDDICATKLLVQRTRTVVHGARYFAVPAASVWNI